MASDSVSEHSVDDSCIDISHQLSLASHSDSDSKTIDVGDTSTVITDKETHRSTFSGTCKVWYSIDLNDRRS